MEKVFGQSYGLSVIQDQVNGWLINWVNRSIIFPNWAKIELRHRLEQWLAVSSGLEETWVQANFNVPTLWLKSDCVIDLEKGCLRIYEIDDCPDGVGVGCLVSSEFRQNLTLLRMHWPKFRPLTTEGRLTDDNLWLSESLPLETKNGYQGLIVARAKLPGDLRLKPFVRQSVSTCLTQSNKSYGVSLGLWREFKGNEADLPWAESFVLKSCRSYGSQGVHIRHKGRFSGVSGKQGIIKALRTNGTMYQQPFIMPMVCPFDPEYLMILRPFFGYNPESENYQFLGGFWLARPGTLKLHGAPDAVIGPLI